MTTRKLNVSPIGIAAAIAVGVATTVGTVLLLGVPDRFAWPAAGVSAALMGAMVIVALVLVRHPDEEARRRRIVAASMLIVGFLAAALGAITLAMGWTAYGLANLWFGAVALLTAIARLRNRPTAKPSAD